jgi:hypothetical protein
MSKITNEKQVSLYLPNTLYTNLKKVADSDYTTVTALMRKILKEYIDSHMGNYLDDANN